MERIWAPWRAEYITGALDGEGCFLCRAWADGDEDRHRVLYRGERAFVIMNLFPYNNGHLMVAAAEHVGDLDLAGPGVRGEMMELANRSVRVLAEAMRPQGFNIGVNLGRPAGAGLADHLHLHVVPRWNGDTNFMPLLADVKVVSEHIDATYRKLKKIFLDT